MGSMFAKCFHNLDEIRLSQQLNILQTNKICLGEYSPHKLCLCVCPLFFWDENFLGF